MLFGSAKTLKVFHTYFAAHPLPWIFFKLDFAIIFCFVLVEFFFLLFWRMQYIYGKDTSLETFVIYVHSCLFLLFLLIFLSLLLDLVSFSVEAERRVVRPLASKPGGTAVRFPCGARELSPVIYLIRMSTWLHRNLEKKNEGEIDTNLMNDPEKNAVSNPSFQNDLYPLSFSPALLLRFRDQRNKEKRKRVHGPKRSECKWFTGLMSKTSLTLSFLRRYLPW